MEIRDTVRIFGRSSSHFTRVATIFARELGVPYELEVIHDLSSLDPEDYGGHPALKLPTLRVGGSVLFGTENICRRLAELARREGDARIVWPGTVRADVVLSAQELVWHAMSAQVQLVLGDLMGGERGDDVFFDKSRRGLQGALAWLDANLEEAIGALPRDRILSLLEVTTFCLVEHLSFRRTAPLDPFPSLLRFQAAFAARPSARETPFRFDPKPSPPK